MTNRSDNPYNTDREYTRNHLNYRGASIEMERNGTYSIYFSGNPYATASSFKTIEEAKQYLDDNAEPSYFMVMNRWT